MEFRLASAAFIAVFATYLFLGGIGVTDRGNPHPRDAAFNLLARGLLSGHLYIDKEVPPVLEQLKDPYDPSANRAVRDDPRYRLHDFSYYRGKLYLYFGVPPALFLFVPWHLVTGGWLAHWGAGVFLCSAARHRVRTSPGCRSPRCTSSTTSSLRRSPTRRCTGCCTSAGSRTGRAATVARWPCW